MRIFERGEIYRRFQGFLRFNNGRSGEVDLEDLLHKHAVAAPLREPEEFSRFYFDSWPTLAWDCGFDIAPETLYERCEQDAPADARTSRG